MDAIRKTLAALLVVLGAAAFAAPASAAEKLITISSDGPGPSEFDRVDVHQFGPSKPDRVLVLMPGTSGGAGDFTLIARRLVEAHDGLAVWAIDRRSQVLEDTAVFASASRSETSLQAMYDYYLGWLTNGGTPADHFNFLDAATVPYAADWGMEVALEDARAVVRKAGKGGRSVLLGGHSLGASLTAAYAAWDFKGKAGFEDVDGIVLIDGGLLGTFDAFNLEQAKEQVDTLGDEPFLDLLGIGIPEAAGLFAEVGGLYARLDPTGDASTLQNSPLLPDEFKPPLPVTNRALFGYAFDRDTSPQGLRLLHVNAGALAPSGEPRDWADGGVTPIANLADVFGQEPANAVEWYFPRLLTIDTNGADQMRQNDVARFLDLRLEHTKQIDVPIYAFQTDLTNGDVLAGARRLIKKAKTTKKQSKLVEGAPEQSHLDPLTAADNEFLDTLDQFLRGLPE
jgi:pimeloyl-ACP methyl ester carboxylesterase